MAGIGRELAQRDRQSVDAKESRARQSQACGWKQAPGLQPALGVKTDGGTPSQHQDLRGEMESLRHVAEHSQEAGEAVDVGSQE